MKSHSKHKMLSIAAVALSLPQMAGAQATNSGSFRSATHIFELCTSRESADIASCELYLMGAHDMAKFYDDTTGRPSFCPSQRISVGRLRELVVGHLRANPDHQRYSAASIVRHLLEQSFPVPCRAN
ncbi:MAG TPA: Rap1a/Tai family immunity protein [Allosphingosinicella sp.]|jgi:hypothetical protein